MAQKLGPNYEVEVNALGGRTVKRDQKDGNGTGKSLSGKLFNGMVYFLRFFPKTFLWI